MARAIQTDTLSGFTLTTREFPEFYSRLMSLRFPISVAEVLELRDLINHSADIYEEPPNAPPNREFRDSLESAIHSFCIENRHHSERLLRVLTMLRGMQYQHTIMSRDAEQRLRQQQAENRKQRSGNLRSGTTALFMLAASGLLWAFIPQESWLPKALALASAITAYTLFRTLPRLDLKMEQLTLELNEVLRKRVDTLNWRTLIHKLSLLLGYKQIQGIEIFRHDNADAPNGNYTLH